MNADFLASCEGKIRFNSYQEAKAAAADLSSNAKPYKCRYGDHYHRGRKAWRR